jgi:DNA-binding MarR family transcriptional regulator
MSKEIASDSGILPNHISNVLRQLKEKDIVECINPEVRKGRLYRLSDNGLDILDELE